MQTQRQKSRAILSSLLFMLEDTFQPPNQEEISPPRMSHTKRKVFDLALTLMHLSCHQRARRVILNQVLVFTNFLVFLNILQAPSIL